MLTERRVGSVGVGEGPPARPLDGDRDRDCKHMHTCSHASRQATTHRAVRPDTGVMYHVVAACDRYGRQRVGVGSVACAGVCAPAILLHTFVDMRIIAYNKNPNNNTRSVLLTWRGVRDWAANEYSSGVMEASSTSQARGVVAASTDRE